MHYVKLSRRFAVPGLFGRNFCRANIVSKLQRASPTLRREALKCRRRSEHVLRLALGCSWIIPVIKSETRSALTANRNTNSGDTRKFNPERAKNTHSWGLFSQPEGRQVVTNLYASSRYSSSHTNENIYCKINVKWAMKYNRCLIIKYQKRCNC